MAPLRIIKFPESVLAKKSKPIELVSSDERELLKDMLETMYLNQGIGLAAPQVGVSKRAIVVDVGEGPTQLINPIIIEKIGREVGQEGCLSLPEVMVDIKRARKIKYKGLDKDGRLIEDEAEGLLARAIQHEIDHLDGRVIIDYANPIKRIFLKRRLIKDKQANTS
jgi:peptide deformylase